MKKLLLLLIAGIFAAGWYFFFNQQWWTSDTVNNENVVADAWDTWTDTFDVQGEVYDLALTIKPSSNTAWPFKAWDVIQFDIEVTNQGSIDADEYSIVDYVPVWLSFVSVTNATNEATTNTHVTWNNASPLAAWASNVHTISFKVTNAAKAGKIKNYAEIYKDDWSDIDSTPDKKKGNDCLKDDVVNLAQC